MKLPTNQNLNRKEHRRNDMKATETVLEEDETESQMSYNVWDSPSNTYCDSALSSSEEVSKIRKVPENDEINFEHTKRDIGGHDSNDGEFSNEFDLNSEDYDQIDKVFASATTVNDNQPKMCLSHDTMSWLLECPKLPDSSFSLQIFQRILVSN